MTQWLVRLGFGQKIQLLINLVSMSVLLSAIFVIGLGFYGQFKSNLEDRVLQKSNLLADAAAVGVVFDQPESVNMLLSSLSVDGGVESAVVYKKHGLGDYQYFAHYSKSSLEPVDGYAYERGPVKLWGEGFFTLRLPILVDNEEVGRIIFKEDDNYLSGFIQTTMAYMLPVIFISMVLVWLVSRAVQNRLAAPLNQLTQAVHEVSYKQDYS